MKKKILSLLIFSILPISSISLASVNDTQFVPQTRIKEAATEIKEYYYLNGNPSDPNRPSEFPLGSTMESKVVKKGLINYIFNVAYLGYMYRLESQIQFNYYTSETFWVKDATYTLSMKDVSMLTDYSKQYVSIISAPESGAGLVTFKLITLPKNDNVTLMKFVTNKADIHSGTDQDNFTNEMNANVATGVEHVGSWAIPYFRRNAGYTLNNGGETTVYTNVDDKLSIDNIMSQVKAQDLFGFDVPITYDGSLYTPGVVGNYAIVIHATDSYGQTSSATVNIVVKDYVAPQIVTKEIEFDCTKTISFDDIKKELAITDNYYKSSDITLESVSISQGFEFGKENSCGEYVNVIRATDPSGNSAEFSVKITVKDVVAPVIRDISGNIPTEPIQVGVSALTTDVERLVLSMFKAEDNYDTSVKVSIAEGQIEKKVGTYELTLRASDVAGNVTDLKVTFNVIADELPVFLLNPLFAITTSDSPLDASKITNLITEALPEGATNLSINQDDINTYMKTKNKAGEHTIRFAYVDSEGEQKDSLIVVQVQGQIDTSLMGQITSSWTMLFTNTSEMNFANWVFIILSLVLVMSIVGLAYYGIMFIKKRQDNKKVKVVDDEDDLNQINTEDDKTEK